MLSFCKESILPFVNFYHHEEVFLLKKTKILSALVGAAMLATAVPASAHGVWFAPRLDQTQLVLGEGYKDNAYDPKDVTMLVGFDKTYTRVPLEIIDGGNHITINPSQNVSVAVVYFDYGYWSKGPDGKYVNKPMDQVPGSTIGTHAIKYSVNYLKGVDKVAPLPDLPYQIVPLKDPTKLNVGDYLPVQVLHNGQPLPNAEIIPDVVNHHTVTMTTDKDGKANVLVANGSINVIGLELAEDYPQSDGKATRDKIFSSLSFMIYPPEDD